MIIARKKIILYLKFNLYFLVSYHNIHLTKNIWKATFNSGDFNYLIGYLNYLLRIQFSKKEISLQFSSKEATVLFYFHIDLRRGGGQFIRDALRCKLKVHMIAVIYKHT